MNWKGFGHGLIYNTILASGLLREGSVPGEKSFQVSQKGQTGKVKSKETTKQTASYTRWPMATTVITMVIHYLISIKKDKKICNRVGPPSRLPGPSYLYSVPPHSSVPPGIYIE
jgi:hypothetical protein